MTEKELKLHGILEKVAKKPLDPSLVEEGASFRDIGLDSLALAELTVRLEQEFGVDVFSDGVIASVAEIKVRIGISGDD